MKPFHIIPSSFYRKSHDKSKKEKCDFTTRKSWNKTYEWKKTILGQFPSGELPPDNCPLDNYPRATIT